MVDLFIRAFSAGLIFLSANHATVVEQLAERPAGSVSCPYSAPNATTQEYVYEIQGRTFCAWRLDADMQAHHAVYVTVVPGTVTAVARGWAWNPTQMIQMNNVTWTPCDLDLSGSFNVNDFVSFLNYPYDWDGNGSFDVNDYVALLNGCGH